MWKEQQEPMGICGKKTDISRLFQFIKWLTRDLYDIRVWKVTPVKPQANLPVRHLSSTRQMHIATTRSQAHWINITHIVVSGTHGHFVT